MDLLPQADLFGTPLQTAAFTVPSSTSNAVTLAKVYTTLTLNWALTGGVAYALVMRVPFGSVFWGTVSVGPPDPAGGFTAQGGRYLVRGLNPGDANSISLATIYPSFWLETTAG